MSIERDSEPLRASLGKKSKVSSAMAYRIEDELNKSSLHAQERSDQMLISGAISSSKAADTNSSHSCESGFASTADEESAECASSTSSSSSCGIASNEISPRIETAQQMNANSESQKQNLQSKTPNEQSQQQFRAIPPFLQSSQSVSIINLDGNAVPHTKHSTVFENNDDNLVILSTSFSSSLNSDSEPKNALQRLMYYLCCCCRCCNVSNTIFWSWLSIFCCCCPLLGGISLYLTRRSNKLKMKQKYELADKYSNCAEKLNIASLIFGILFYAFAFFMVTLVIFMYWRHSNA